MVSVFIIVFKLNYAHGKIGLYQYTFISMFFKLKAHFFIKYFFKYYFSKILYDCRGSFNIASSFSLKSCLVESYRNRVYMCL